MHSFGICATTPLEAGSTNSMACTNTGTERTGICGLEQSGTISAVSIPVTVKLSAAGGVVLTGHCGSMLLDLSYEAHRWFARRIEGQRCICRH